MIVTEPLPPACLGHPSAGPAPRPWATSRTPTRTPQRTADGRIALGGRGRPVPLRLPDRQRRADVAPATARGAARGAGPRFFPATSPGCAIDHAWSGVLGVPRDWCATASRWTVRPGSAGPAATSAVAWPPPTSWPAPSRDLVRLDWQGQRTELHRAALGGPPGTALGAGAVAVGGGAGAVRGVPGRGPAGSWRGAARRRTGWRGGRTGCRGGGEGGRRGAVRSGGRGVFPATAGSPRRPDVQSSFNSCSRCHRESAPSSSSVHSGCLRSTCH